MPDPSLQPPALPVLIVGLLAFALALVLVRCSPFYTGLIARESALSKRFHVIDGLRGYLAIGVVFHHIILTQHFYYAGVWELTASRLTVFLGRASVAFFFMITAFLFWGHALDAGGRLDSTRFYSSRLRRLVPMYLFSAALLIVTALALSHFRRLESIDDLVRHICAWLLFTIPGVPDINTLPKTYLINTVFWSLAYEWKFYLLLPLLAVFARPRAQFGLAAIVALAIWCFSDTQLEWFFMAGCLAAVAVRSGLMRRVRVSVNGVIGAVVAIACLGAMLVWQPMVYSAAGAVLLFVPFAIFASGNSLFGLLINRPARFLGLLSYSIYLLHNWVLYLLARLVNHFGNAAELSRSAFWAFGALVLMTTILIATLTYRYVELPFLRSSRPDRGQEDAAPAR